MEYQFSKFYLTRRFPLLSHCQHSRPIRGLRGVPFPCDEMAFALCCTCHEDAGNGDEDDCLWKQRACRLQVWLKAIQRLALRHMLTTIENLLVSQVNCNRSLGCITEQIMAFWFGINSMVRSAGLESSSSSSIPQTSARNLLSALSSSSPSPSSSSASSQWQQAHRHRQQQPQQSSQPPTTKDQRHHQTAPSPTPFPYGHIPTRDPFSYTHDQQRQRGGDIALRSSLVQRLQPQASPSSHCSYCLTGTSFSWTHDDDRGYMYDRDVVGAREQGLRGRWKEWGRS
jgi:hypothetical protein